MASYCYTKKDLKKYDLEGLYLAFGDVLRNEYNVVKCIEKDCDDFESFNEYFMKDYYLHRMNFLSNQKKIILKELKKRGEWKC